MRTLLRSMILSVIIFFIMIFYYSEPQNTEPLTDSNYATLPKVDQFNDKEVDDGTDRPTIGLSTYIGKPIDDFVENYGSPKRKDPSAYGYEWWIYNDFEGTYMQVGVDDDSVVTIYAIGNQLNVSPYTIGQTIEEIFKSTYIETEIVVSLNEGSYRFELSEEDLNIRPLVQLGDIYALLSIDKYSSMLSSIRFFDKKSLIMQRPYELIYRGDLIEPDHLSEEEWRAIDEGNEQQIFEITNVIRNRFELETLEWDEGVAKVAYDHSKDMYENNFFSHESSVFGSLNDRLDANEIQYQSAGENIATEYNDGPAAVEGWLNSEGHRKVILNKDFNVLGVGVAQKYYTQNFIQAKNAS